MNTPAETVVLAGKRRRHRRFLFAGFIPFVLLVSGCGPRERSDAGASGAGPATAPATSAPSAKNGSNADELLRQAASHKGGFLGTYDKEGLALLERAAALGSAEAMYQLGFHYSGNWSIGRADDRDDAKAVDWYRKAVAAGSAPAMERLGWMYYCGNGVPKDPTETMKYYRMAADAGYAPAYFEIGELYEGGEGITQDTNAAIQWYRKAADSGNADAMYRLGLIYEGEVGGLPKDHEAAVAWMKKAYAAHERYSGDWLKQHGEALPSR